MEDSTANLPSLQRTSRSKGKGSMKFTQMKRSQSQSCTLRSTIPSTLSKRYENVQKITMLIEDINIKDLPKGQKIHQVVVEGFKQKIRNTFNELYGNYEQNKEHIVKQIKNLEKNKTSHIEMTTKFQQTLKQKNQYDKLKLQCQIKSKKLAKLKQILQRQMYDKTELEELQEQLRKKITQQQQHWIISQNLNYQKAVLQNLRVSRRALKQQLKKRFDDMFQLFSQRSRKINKFYNQNEVKRRLVLDIQKQMPSSQVDIPENFAIELENKLQHLYGKQAFQNIFYHESIINEEANRQQHQRELLQRESRRKIKQQAERQQKRQLDRVQLQYAKNKQLQQRFLKQCGIRSLSQLVQYKTGQNRHQLQAIKYELQSRIQTINKQNQEISNQIKKVLSQNINIETTIKDVQKDYIKEHEQQKMLNYVNEKNQKFLQYLESYIDRITEQPGPIEDMSIKLFKFKNKIELLQDSPRKSKTANRKKKFIRIRQLQNQLETDNTILAEKEEDYLDEQNKNIKDR